MPDCGSHSCFYAETKTGQRTNGHCKCDQCPDCGRSIRPKHGFTRHYVWCVIPEWVPEHHLDRIPVRVVNSLEDLKKEREEDKCA